MDEAAIELRFDAQRYGYWQQVDVRSSVDDLCAEVHLAYIRPGAGSSLGLTANSIVDVLIGEDLVTTTRSDTRRRRVDAESHVMRFTGRSLARELVDCQYSLTLSGLRLGEIVKRLCDTFKVPVKIDADTAVVPDFSMQCEVPANALINAVRASNLLLYPLPSGGLILTKPTDDMPVATVEYGVNIESYEIIDEDKLRFSDYVVKGYDYASDLALKGASKDAGITFFRPFHVVADKHGKGLGGCERRAELERNRRQARAHRIEIEVPGWRYQDVHGVWHPWEINTRVRVMIDNGDDQVDEVMLIGERAFKMSPKQGKTTVLQVMDRAAFLGEEKKKAKRGAGVKKK